MLAIDPRIRVLYVEGRLRPEYKPLTLALSRDRMIELATRPVNTLRNMSKSYHRTFHLSSKFTPRFFSCPWIWHTRLPPLL